MLPPGHKRRCRALALMVISAIGLGLCGGAAAQTAARQVVGILAVDAPSEALEERLALALPRAPALSRWLVLGPAELRARLLAAPAIQAAVSRAQAGVATAEQALAQMERGGALAAAREAQTILSRSAARVHSPRLVARAQLVLARAWLLQPANPRAGLAAMRVAISHQPDLKPDLRTMSPQVAKMLRRARAEVAAQRRAGTFTRPAGPTTSDLARLAAAAQVPLLVSVELKELQGGGRELAIRLYDQGRGRLEQPKAAALVAESPVEQQAAQALAAKLLRRPSPAGGPTTMLASSAASASKTKTPQVVAIPTPVSNKPNPASSSGWYKRWWVWAAVGVAIAAGAGVTIYAATREDPSGYDVTVRY